MTPKSCCSAFLLALLLVAAPAFAAAPPYVTTKVDGKEVRLPLVGGMVAACDQDPRLVQIGISLTPRSSTFVTCMATPAALEGIRKHDRLEAYPMLTTGLVNEVGSEPISTAQFAQVSAISKQRLGTMGSDPDQGPDEFFEFSRTTPSFTTLVTRRLGSTEPGTTEKNCEVRATTSLLVNGRILIVQVMDHCAGVPPHDRAKTLTKKWLTRFEALNPPGK